MLRLGVTNDVDLAPFFFPIEAGWAATPPGLVTKNGLPLDLENWLLAGELDVAPVGPLTYARHQDQLLLLPLPVRAYDMASDALFLISSRRLDKFDKPKVAVSPSGATGEAILKLVERSFYSFEAQFQKASSEIAALDALRTGTDMCIVSGETGMRAVGPAKGKGYFVEDLSKVWWLNFELSLPLHIFGVRKAWTEQNPDAQLQIRAVMQLLRGALQQAKEQMPTLSERLEKRTGLPAEALVDHYTAQRYEFNQTVLRGLLDFYRRSAQTAIAPAVLDLNFYPPLGPAASGPTAVPRRSVSERPVELVQNNPKIERGSTRPRSTSAAARSGREKAEAQGLRLIKGGKDSTKQENEEPEE